MTPNHLPSKRQTKFLFALEILLHIALAELIHFALHHLIKTFPNRYWLVLTLPLCLIIIDEFFRVWFIKTNKQTLSTSNQVTMSKMGQGGKWQYRGETKEENQARLGRMRRLVEEKNKELGVSRKE